MYPSQVVKKYTGIEQDTAYQGFDPLRLFIENGHKAGLRIHAWFEFGFSYAYQDSSQAQWLKKYPAWAGRDNQGRLLKKNNFSGGTDYIRKFSNSCRNLYWRL